jgi:hypothetical protein
MFVITTNEPISHFHQAVVRPGRCASRVEFEARCRSSTRRLGSLLAGPPRSRSAEGPATVADLFAMAAGDIEPQARARRGCTCEPSVARSSSDVLSLRMAVASMSRVFPPRKATPNFHRFSGQDRRRDVTWLPGMPETHRSTGAVSRLFRIIVRSTSSPWLRCCVERDSKASGNVSLRLASRSPSPMR